VISTKASMMIKIASIHESGSDDRDSDSERDRDRDSDSDDSTSSSEDSFHNDENKGSIGMLMSPWSRDESKGMTDSAGYITEREAVVEQYYHEDRR
jgi:hypothetical protein